MKFEKPKYGLTISFLFTMIRWSGQVTYIQYGLACSNKRIVFGISEKFEAQPFSVCLSVADPSLFYVCIDGSRAVVVWILVKVLN